MIAMITNDILVIVLLTKLAMKSGEKLNSRVAKTKRGSEVRFFLRMTCKHILTGPKRRKSMKLTTTNQVEM